MRRNQTGAFGDSGGRPRHYVVLGLKIPSEPTLAALQRTTRHKLEKLISIVFCIAGIAFGFFAPIVSLSLFAVVAAT